MKICMVGTGYVGLVTGACLAESGNYIKCVDIDEEKCRSLKGGEIPIYEPGLDDLVRKNAKEGRLKFTTSIEEGMAEADFLFIAVGTPPDANGDADLSHVETVAKDIGRYMKDYTIVVIKSTVPVGTTLRMKKVIKKALRDRHLDKMQFDIAFCPEFLREGSAIGDFMNPDRVVIGTESDRAKSELISLFSPLTGGENGIYSMTIESAELTKYAANSMLATRISFMNEISKICSMTGANVEDVRRGIGSDRRIGPSFLKAGIGYGGSCFPKDVKALIGTARELGLDMDLLKSVESINEGQKTLPVKWSLDIFGEDLSDKIFVIWGLSFKPETDDMREAASLKVIRGLREHGANVRVFDPVALDKARSILGEEVSYYEDSYSPLKGADCLIVATEWSLFRDPDFHHMIETMKTPIILDGRNIYDPEKMSEMGFTYRSVGR